MIPRYLVEEWREKAPWQSLDMVEQDLIISRALVELYSHSLIRESLAFRGGTALNKLHIFPPQRYSEDIDLVQINSGPIGKLISAIREVLDNWLGEPKRKLTERSAKLIYRFDSVEGRQSKLKIEINTTEHFHVHPLELKEFSIQSEWARGSAELLTFHLNELMGTKLRALYQRRKGRDLFDLWYMLDKNMIDTVQVVEIFKQYNQYNKQPITRAMFEESLFQKEKHAGFMSDMQELLVPTAKWNPVDALRIVRENVMPKLSGDPWKSKKA